MVKVNSNEPTTPPQPPVTKIKFDSAVNDEVMPWAEKRGRSTSNVTKKYDAASTAQPGFRKIEIINVPGDQ